MNLVIDDYLNITHKNYSELSESFYYFLKNYLFDDNYIKSLSFDYNCHKKNEKFIYLKTFLILCSPVSNNKSETINEFLEFFGERYITSLNLNLSLFLRNIRSPRNVLVKDIFGKNTKDLISCIENAISIVSKYESELNDNFSNYIHREMKFDKKKERPQTIAILIDDLSPQKLNTITRMVFDLANVITEKTSLKLLIISSKLHAPNNKFWIPGVHQTANKDLDHFLKIFGQKYQKRINLVYLNDYYYNHKTVDFNFDVILSYRFKHNIEQISFFSCFPVVELEVMSGMAIKNKETHFDILIPNGIPSEELLKKYFSDIVLVRQPRIKFTGNEKSKIDYLCNEKKIIVTCAKDFDLRPEIDSDLFFQKVSNFLNENIEYQWVIIGISEHKISSLKDKYLDLINSYNLVLRSFEENLPALLRNAFLCVHPPIYGGGRTVSISIENKCPALTFDFGDSIRSVPKEMQFSSYEEIFTSIHKLSKSEQLYSYFIKIGLDMVSGSINNESVITYVSSFDRAYQKAIFRLSEQ